MTKTEPLDNKHDMSRKLLSMVWIDELYNRARGPGFLINSLPKSGTNLLEKAVALMPGIRDSGIVLDHMTGERLCRSFPSGAVTLPIGVGWPMQVPRAALDQTLGKVGHGQFLLGHVPFNPEMASLLSAHGMKTLLILRDPRDVALSLAKYLPTRPKNKLHPYFAPLSEEERITAALCGLRSDTGEQVLLGMRDAMESVLPWRAQAGNYTTFFERIIGPEGGGSREEQLGEISRVAQHLGARCSRREVEKIGDNLFGGTRTFFKGMIGSWRDCFTPEHIRLAKESFGDLLVDLGYERGMDW